MKIGIDIDGVLANFTDSYSRILMDLDPSLQFPNASKSWPTTWYWDRAAGTSKDTENQAWELVKASTFWGMLKPLDGGIETLQYLSVLRSLGHDIIFITSRPGKLAKLYTEMWLAGHGMPNPTVIIADAKGPVAASLALDVFIDDRDKNIQDVLDHSPETQCYIIDWAYNKDFNPIYNPDYHLEVKRADSALDALDDMFPHRFSRAA